MQGLGLCAEPRACTQHPTPGHPLLALGTDSAQGRGKRRHHPLTASGVGTEAKQNKGTRDKVQWPLSCKVRMRHPTLKLSSRHHGGQGETWSPTQSQAPQAYSDRWLKPCVRWLSPAHSAHTCPTCRAQNMGSNVARASDLSGCNLGPAWGQRSHDRHLSSLTLPLSVSLCPGKVRGCRSSAQHT